MTALAFGFPMAVSGSVDGTPPDMGLGVGVGLSVWTAWDVMEKMASCSWRLCRLGEERDR